MKIAPVDRYANWRATGSESRAAAASRLQTVASESTAPAVPAALASSRELPVLAVKQADNAQSRPVRSSDTPRGAEPALNLFRQFQSLAQGAVTVALPASPPDYTAVAGVAPGATAAAPTMTAAPGPATDFGASTNGAVTATAEQNRAMSPPANPLANALADPAASSLGNLIAANASNLSADATGGTTGAVVGSASAPATTLPTQAAGVPATRPERPQTSAQQDDVRLRPEDLLKQRDAVANAGRITSQRFNDIAQAQAQSTEAARQQAAEEARNTPPKEPLTQLLMDQVRSLWEASRGVIDAASPPDKPGAPARQEPSVAGAGSEARPAAMTSTATAPAISSATAFAMRSDRNPASGATNA